ncbi:hypothetical protein [Pseudomonas sp. TE50-2]|uniref:hypothetical protein n=1 Tax=Pseudomonas sp. TE50-2 TaxID=3142707 RepID=UPI003466374A
MKTIGMLAFMSVVNLSVATDAVAEGMVSPRPDGSAIDWRLDRPTGGGKVGLVVLAQGSGCLSEAKNTNLAGVRAYFPGYAALTVEKYGVAPQPDLLGVSGI